jgi:predicted nucleic acid-binding protein
VMGEDVLKPNGAWRAYDTLRADPRVIFVPEQAGFSDHWRSQANRISGGPNGWTDAYLAAFSSHGDLTLVTFDRGFSTSGSSGVLTLSI